jgi:hypothetical protein
MKGSDVAVTISRQDSEMVQLHSECVSEGNCRELSAVTTGYTERSDLRATS